MTFLADIKKMASHKLFFHLLYFGLLLLGKEFIQKKKITNLMQNIVIVFMNGCI